MLICWWLVCVAQGFSNSMVTISKKIKWVCAPTRLIVGLHQLKKAQITSPLLSVLPYQRPTPPSLY